VRVYGPTKCVVRLDYLVQAKAVGNQLLGIEPARPSAATLGPDARTQMVRTAVDDIGYLCGYFLEVLPEIATEYEHVAEILAERSHSPPPNPYLTKYVRIRPSENAHRLPQAIHPPSTVRLSPVVYPASGLARYATAAAVSSGLPKRPTLASLVIVA
jgi:hypothetical protein